MRRTLIPALVLFVALPLCAQRRWGSAPQFGGSVSIQSGRSFGRGGSVGFRGGNAGFRGSVSFGRNPRMQVFVGPGRIHHVRRWVTYPYSYAPAYVYPYSVIPAFPVSYYDANVYYTPQPAQQPAYPAVVYDYSGVSADAEVGLAEQMRRQNLGIYRKYPYATESTPAPRQTTPPAQTEPEPERPLTLLVYRDGKTVEVRNYAVIGQTLWIFSEERSQKVPLAQLDLEATRKANDERGVEFTVPKP